MTVTLHERDFLPRCSICVANNKIIFWKFWIRKFISSNIWKTIFFVILKTCWRIILWSSLKTINITERIKSLSFKLVNFLANYRWRRIGDRAIVRACTDQTVDTSQRYEKLSKIFYVYEFLGGVNVIFLLTNIELQNYNVC